MAPLASALAAHLSWRDVLLILALVLAVITVPAHALFLRPPWAPGRDAPTTAAGQPARKGRGH